MSTNCGRVTVTGLPGSTSVKVVNHGTTTEVDLYATRTGTTTAANPVTTDTFGHLTFFAAAGQDVDLVYATTGELEARLTFSVWPDPQNSWIG